MKAVFTALALSSVATCAAAQNCSESPRSFAAEQASDVPHWLMAHVGEGEGQIAQVGLQRARTLYFQKVREGAVRNLLFCHGCHAKVPPSGPGWLYETKHDGFRILARRDAAGGSLARRVW